MSIAVPSLWLPYIASPFTKKASFSPKDIAGLTAWFDASQITGVADGASLATWPDSSGNGNDATQGTAADQPTYYKSTAGKTINGLPAVWWTSATDSLATAAFEIPLSVGTVFVVGEVPDNGQVPSLVDGISSTNRWVVGTTANSAYCIYAGGNIIGAVPNNGAIHQFTGLFAGAATSYFRMDGIEQASGSAGTDTLTGITLGNGPGAELDLYPDFLCEIIHYDSILSSTDISKVESYLKSKWATP